ncbi:MAG: DNA topoisomerase (ATP-hydrolyzing) [Eubacteriales bacterium]
MKQKHLTDQSIILEQTMEQVMHNSMMPFSEFVILERALPRVEDGLKPVQRRVLYVMLEQGLAPDKPFRKSANIVGETMAKYHPHGDASIYDTMVRLAQDFSMRTPLVEGNGNFGSMDGDPPAAYRYTEARLSPAALSLMEHLDKETVSWSLNFDDTRREPDVFPAGFPNLLINGATGIAVGFSTNIPPHHPAEVIDGVAAYLNRPKLTLRELRQIVRGPDFPTGGIISNGEDLEALYEGGAGKLVLRAKATVETLPDGKPAIVITEFPFQTNKAELLARVLEHAQSRKEIIAQISDIRDESDRTGVRAVIELKKDCDAERLLAYLYRYTDLQKNYYVNMTAIADGKPRQMGLLELVRRYAEFRQTVERRRVEFDLKEALARAEVLEGLSIAAQHIDRVIQIIKTSKTPAVAKERLMETFGLSERQASAILDMRLRRITQLEAEEVEQELAAVRALVAELEGILASPAKLNAVIRASLAEIKKKLKGPRQTEILYGHVEEEVGRDAFKTVEDTVVYVDENSCLHRVSEKTFENLIKTTEIPPELVVMTKTNATLLVFGEKGNCYALKVEAIPEGKSKDKGSIPEKLMADFVDKQVLCLCDRDATDPGEKLLFVTQMGMVKCSAFEEYVIRRTKFESIVLVEGDRLVYVGRRLPGRHLELTDAADKKKVWRDPVKVTGRKTRGNKVGRLAVGQRFVSGRQV